jgi:aspartate kinase
VPNLLVLKFGGTAVGTPARVRRAARRIAAHVRSGVQVVSVVSAAGHSTDRLLASLSRVTGAEPPAPNRETDRVLATGEELSAALVAAALDALGCPARSFRGGEAGLHADGGWGAGRLVRFDPAPLCRSLEDGITPVVAGFQAAGLDGETRTLGRGASDLTAVYLAARLGAVECHIVTDVDGVYDADPRRAVEARRHALMSHAALLSLAEGGAEIVHAGAAREALIGHVPLQVYSYAAPLRHRTGTRIQGVA